MPLADQLQTMLDDLSTTLSEIESAQQGKRRALASIDPQVLVEHTKIESRLAAAMADHARRRAELLQQAPSPIKTLDELIPLISPERQAGMRERLQRIQSQTRSIKQQLAMNWLTTWRVNQYVAELLRIMAGAIQGEGQSPRQGLCMDSTA